MEKETSPTTHCLHKNFNAESTTRMKKEGILKNIEEVVSESNFVPVLTLNDEQNVNNSREMSLTTNCPATPEIEEKCIELSNNTNYNQNDASVVNEKEIKRAEIIELSNPSLISTSEVFENSCIACTTELSTISGGLRLLAQYDSDNENQDGNNKGSDTDAVVEVFETGMQEGYRKKCLIEIDSEADTDTSDNSGSEGEYLTTLRKEINKNIETVDDEDMNEDENCVGANCSQRRQPPRVKGEMLLEDLPPIQDLQITVPEEACVELGRVQSIVKQLVLVSSLPNAMLLDLETVLFLDKGRKVLGKIFDVLGQVADPLYCVRFNSNNQIKEREINIGDIVYCAPKTEHSQFVILSQIMQKQGSDASWENDLEPPARYLDYSDDEEERTARTHLRNRQGNDAAKHTRTQLDPETADYTTSEPSLTQPSQRPHSRRGNRQSSKSQHSVKRSEWQMQRHAADQQCGNHPRYNTNSWHSNYYHNYHSSIFNYNMPPTALHVGNVTHAYSSYPMPYTSYGAMPHYSLPQPYNIGPTFTPPTSQSPLPHLYPQSSYGSPPQQPPPS